METDYKNCSYKILRKFNYEYVIDEIQETYSIDLTSFIKNPYTYLKSRYFLELSTLIIYFLRKTNITPNMVSLLTPLSAIIGGILILLPDPYLLCLGLFLIINGYVFDWCDGLLARVNKQSSLTGKILDDWSTHFFALAFRLSIGLYVATHTNSLFFYLVPLIVFLPAINIKIYFQSSMFDDLLRNKLKLKKNNNQSNFNNNETKSNNPKDYLGKYLKYILFLSSFLDDRSRNIDFFCFLIFIEKYLNLDIVWLIFISMILKELLRSIINITFIIKSGWCETKVEPNP